MKRFYKILELVVMVIVVAALPVHCTKNGGEFADIIGSLFQKGSFHGSYVLDGDDFSESVAQGVVPSTVEITSGGRYVLGFVDPGAETGSPLVYVTGYYSMGGISSDGTEAVFEFDGYGSIRLRDGKGTVEVLDYVTYLGDIVEGTATTLPDVVYGTLAESIFGSWKPTSLIISVSGGDNEPVMGRIFSPDLKDLFVFLKGYGVEVDEAEYSKYALSVLDFTESGLFVISFENGDTQPFVGDYSLHEERELNIDYDFSKCWDNNPLVPLSGSGFVTVGAGMLSFYTETDVDVRGTGYHVSVSILCSRNEAVLSEVSFSRQFSLSEMLCGIVTENI